MKLGLINFDYSDHVISGAGDSTPARRSGQSGLQPRQVCYVRHPGRGHRLRPRHHSRDH